jgi:UDP-glucose 4-epimerase
MNEIRDKKVLITGGAGFIGSFIADQLIAEDVGQVVILDNFVRGSRENISRALSSGRAALVEGDITDRDLLDYLFQDVDYCFHMAAHRINHCVAEPRLALEVMFDGTFNVIEACVNHNVKKIVAASSASIYGTADTFPTMEDHHPYNNHTLYGVAKVANEGMLRAFHDMNGLKYNAMRYFNVYGPRMDVNGRYTEVLIRWYTMIKEKKAPVIYGDGKQTMDFVYVEDVARANLLALKTDVNDEVFNVGYGVETSLKGLCEALLDAIGSDLRPQYVSVPEERKKVEVARRLADTRKSRELLGFSAKISLREGLKNLLNWLDSRNLP